MTTFYEQNYGQRRPVFFFFLHFYPTVRLPSAGRLPFLSFCSLVYDDGRERRTCQDMNAQAMMTGKGYS